MAATDPPGRPPVLFPLFAGIDTLPGVGPKAALALESLAITRPRDLILTLPHTVIDRRRRETVQGIAAPSVATVEVTVGRHIRPTRRGGPWRVQVEDARIAFQLVFFHAREDWLARELPTGQRRLVSGKVEIFDGVAQMVHPDHILRPEEAGQLPLAEPVYPLAAGLTQKTMARAAQGALTRVPDLAEWIDPALLAREGWPGWRAALLAAHAPQAPQACAAGTPARRASPMTNLLRIS
jgi:ATP-dependent DNA helicase RecG